MALEHEVMAQVLYVARFVPHWADNPYWLLHRCVVPYVAVNQFVVLQRDRIPIAYAGWVFEQPDGPRPWRDDRYLPAASEITGEGACCITEMITPFLPPDRVVDEVVRAAKLASAPAWVERDGMRVVVAVHQRNPHFPEH